jgi:hypothetical protein
VDASDDDPDDYPLFLQMLRARFARITQTPRPLFTTDTPGLEPLFLEALPTEVRARYTCRACLRFIDRYGGLATIDEDGRAHPLFWEPEDVPEFFKNAALRLAPQDPTGVQARPVGLRCLTSRTAPSWPSSTN